MESLKTLLVANRAEIACRIIKTAKKLDIKTIAIYTQFDAASLHVTHADEAVLLPNDASYMDGEAILAIAKDRKVDAIIPGYGFLSENASFARLVLENGITWVGPSPEAIETFGIKHVARRLATKAGIPTVSGTDDLVKDADDARQHSKEIGFPVMLKATGGGGGLGLVICNDEEEVRHGFEAVTARGQALFHNPGLFIERYISRSRHIEIQILGDGQGGAIDFGERECSLQRRHQKVVEECPSPFLTSRSGLRDSMCEAAISLAKSIKYTSAGTVEFLVDDETGEFFFLEMNTRLQVEHGITELCYKVDLVESMLRIADMARSNREAQLREWLHTLKSGHVLRGAAIEARIYAENPARGYAPSPGTITELEWYTAGNTRLDTWVTRGQLISSHYDPLIAKLMFYSDDGREQAIAGIREALENTSIRGLITNVEFLTQLIGSKDFSAGRTLTTTVPSFSLETMAIDVIAGGSYTLIQDYPGRPAIGKGIPHSGPMDPVAHQIANILVGNDPGMEALEITLSGPELKFLAPAIIALCGAPVAATMDYAPLQMWTRTLIRKGQTLKIGKMGGAGCRSVLAIHGGFPNIPQYFGSKSTSPVVAIGGLQGRALAAGDLLAIEGNLPKWSLRPLSLPQSLIPSYEENWEIMAMPGPHDEGFLTAEDIAMIFETQWKVSHNASRSGIRLLGPTPTFARKDGGEGGSHPSNLCEFGYPLGGQNFTGDEPCIFPLDAPNFGGFMCSPTIPQGEWWKVGQLKAGNTVRYRKVGYETAVSARKTVNAFISRIEQAARDGNFDAVEALSARPIIDDCQNDDDNKAIIDQIKATDVTPLTTYRQGGDSYVLVCYGSEQFDLNHRRRVSALEKALFSVDSTPEHIRNGLVTSVGCCASITINFDPLLIHRSELVTHLKRLEDQLGDLTKSKFQTRRFRLPITFESKAQEAATKRYMETIRPQAPYLPDNLKFVAENNAFTPERLKEIYLTGTLAAVVVGFFCGNTVSLPVDPRERMSCPKTNPSRNETPSGTVGWGGSCMSIYPVTCPGGYQMTGRTIPPWDPYGTRPGFSRDRPWLFKDFDLLTFYEVTEAEMDKMLADFEARKYIWQFDEVEFDMAEHNALLESTAAEVKEIRKSQATAQEVMMKREAESLAKWKEERSRNKVDENVLESMLNEEGITAVEAPVDANVWKVLVREGDEVKAEQTLCILEAMKLEINVNVPTEMPGLHKLEKLLIESGETIKAGSKIALLRKI